MAHDLTVKRMRLAILDYLLGEARDKRSARQLAEAVR
jgi:hypothetical protein